MYLLFDIGGTYTRIATSSGKSLQNIKTYPTPLNFRQAIKLFDKTAKYLLGDKKIDSAVGGVKGPLDKSRGIITSSSKLLNWVNKPLKAELERILHAPVILENDSALEGLAEAIIGAGKNYKTVGFLNVGTGVGGVRIVDCKIDELSVGFEPGHNIFIEGVELENLISGPAIKKKYSDNPNWDQICHYLQLGLIKLIETWSPDIFVLGGGVTRSLPL
jgi:glucokinase